MTPLTHSDFSLASTSLLSHDAAKLYFEKEKASSSTLDPDYIHVFFVIQPDSPEELPSIHIKMVEEAALTALSEGSCVDPAEEKEKKRLELVKKILLSGCVLQTGVQAYMTVTPAGFIYRLTQGLGMPAAYALESRFKIPHLAQATDYTLKAVALAVDPIGTALWIASSHLTKKVAEKAIVTLAKPHFSPAHKLLIVFLSQNAVSTGVIMEPSIHSRSLLYDSSIHRLASSFFSMLGKK